MDETKETYVGITTGIVEYKGRRYIAITPVGGTTQLFTPEYVATFVDQLADLIMTFPGWEGFGCSPEEHEGGEGPTLQ